MNKEKYSSITLERMWINQPSTLQPLHHLHGVNVLAYLTDNETRVWFISGDTISMDIPRNILARGWLA